MSETTSHPREASSSTSPTTLSTALPGANVARARSTASWSSIPTRSGNQPASAAHSASSLASSASVATAFKSGSESESRASRSASQIVSNDGAGELFGNCPPGARYVDRVVSYEDTFESVSEGWTVTSGSDVLFSPSEASVPRAITPARMFDPVTGEAVGAVAFSTYESKVLHPSPDNVTHGFYVGATKKEPLEALVEASTENSPTLSAVKDEPITGAPIVNLSVTSLEQSPSLLTRQLSSARLAASRKASADTSTSTITPVPCSSREVQEAPRPAPQMEMPLEITPVAESSHTADGSPDQLPKDGAPQMPTSESLPPGDEIDEDVSEGCGYNFCFCRCVRFCLDKTFSCCEISCANCWACCCFYGGWKYFKSNTVPAPVPQPSSAALQVVNPGVVGNVAVPPGAMATLPNTPAPSIRGAMVRPSTMLDV